jgi:hypothetical protein
VTTDDEEGRSVVCVSRWLTYRSKYTAVAAIAANSGSTWCDTGGAGAGLRSLTGGAPARTYMLSAISCSMLFLYI